MSEFKLYQRTGVIEARPYIEGEPLDEVSLGAEDRRLPTLVGGMIARNPSNHADRWYINEAYFQKNYAEPV